MKRRCRAVSLRPALLGGAALVCANTHGQVRYTVQAIGPHTATHINNIGQVIGIDSNISYSWTAEHGLEEIPTVGERGYSLVYGLNDNGKVVGYSYSENSQGQGIGHEAIVWDRSSGTSKFFDFGAGLDEARDINNLGQIVGFHEPTGAFRNDAWSWSPSAGLTWLPKLDPNKGSAAFLVNDSGLVYGKSIDSREVIQSVFWRPGGGIDVISHMAGQVQTDLSDLNNDGTSCGISFGNLGDAGFVRYADGTYDRVLNPLNPGILTWATGINDQRLAVGRLFDRNFQYKGFVWTKDGGTKVINDLLAPGYEGWDVRFAMDVNNSGQISGVGTFNGQSVGVLLNPVPEPGLLLMLAPGLYLVARRRRRRP